MQHRIQRSLAVCMSSQVLQNERHFCSEITNFIVTYMISVVVSIIRYLHINVCVILKNQPTSERDGKHGITFGGVEADEIMCVIRVISLCQSVCIRDRIISFQRKDKCLTDQISDSPAVIVNDSHPNIFPVRVQIGSGFVTDWQIFGLSITTEFFTIRLNPNSRKFHLSNLNSSKI